MTTLELLAMLEATKGEPMSMTTSMSTLSGVGSPLRLAAVTDMERMYGLDEAWNARDWLGLA